MRDCFELDQAAENRDLEKYANFSFILDAWLSALEHNKYVTDYFIKNNYKTVCIYGMGLLGKHLLEQLNGSEIDVLYTIDRNIVRYPDASSGDINKIKKIVTVPDVIVITPLLEFKRIKNNLEKYFNTNIVSLEEIIMTL